jgi:ComF family protein
MLMHLAKLIAPPSCLACGLEGYVICGGCQASLVANATACLVCGQPNADGLSCPGCQRLIHGATLPCRYEGLAKRLITAYKFERLREASTVIAHILCSHLPAPAFEVVTEVPSAPQRIRQRGFDHAARLASAVAYELRVPYRPLLFRRHNSRQVGKNRSDRMVQAAVTFGAPPTRFQRVLLIDDVVTTGASVMACARALQAAGVRQVWVAALAREPLH